ncbi:hypothetical protein [Actinomadura rubteroloni]|nr:hypothetical protein [Actinomadura rubteroloni]
MTLTAQDGTGSGRDWVVVLAAFVLAETAILWVGACLGVWRRRRALRDE